MSTILQAQELTKTYQSGDQRLTVIDKVSFEVAKGTTCAIVGPSGSGKTTLLGLCAGLDRPSAGQISLRGIELTDLNEEERAALRNRYVGFVFQTFQLIPTLTALENVMVPLELSGQPDARDKSTDWLERVGLGERLSHYPAQLSGGEQQRVALARAFVNEPQILFADEPTGNLDTDTGSIIEDLLFELNRQVDTTLVLVTHDLKLADRTERVLHLEGGQLYEENRAARTSDSIPS